MNKAFRAVDHRRVALHFDVLRYSFAMAKLAAERMRDTLDKVASLHREEQHSEECVISALLDAWSLVDMSHRARQVVDQLPQLPRKDRWVKSFLTRTDKVEKLRHHVQHLRRSVNDPTVAEPLWGALSWVPRDNPTECYTIFSGNLLEGHSAESISYDRVELRYTAEVELSAAGGNRVDLWAAAQALQQFRADIVEWIRQKPNTKHAYGQTLVWRWWDCIDFSDSE